VRLTAGGRSQVDEVRSGGSYLSQNDLRLHFGLGPATKIDRIEIDWPSGVRQAIGGREVNTIVTISEPDTRVQKDAGTRDNISHP
jgi:hypothetical protein